ncbi:uracil-DNA glycosylase [Marinicrinis lubricantis]|uniref:Uracil-DNA glycosylase n=1 Tax=Marinicrinis lubricantis TaxID=2086470 RepID=A0ABW1IK53_9BACL
MKVNEIPGWSMLESEFQQPYFERLIQFLKKEYENETIFPEKERIFHALRSSSYEHTRVLILGQDPYHGKGQAHGLSFSVQPGVQVPPSLRNIFKELQDDLGCTIPDHGYLQPWAEQGVLLLNSVLTVREGQPNSHQGRGWERFTDRVMAELNRKHTPVVFILWGKYAEAKKKLITQSHHLVITSPHPSPLSARRGFFGSRPFSRTNAFLREQGLMEIDWQLPPIVKG